MKKEMLMRRQDYTLFLVLTALLLVGLLHGCSTAPDPEPPLQTLILGVTVDPNPVAIGDTATFTCIIEDSLDKRFKFEWGIEGDESLRDTVTEKNIFKWLAPDNPKEYLHTVHANNGSQDSVAPGRSFTITVSN